MAFLLSIGIIGILEFKWISESVFTDMPIFISEAYDRRGQTYYGFLIDNKLIIGYRRRPIYKPSDLQILSVVKERDFMDYFSISSDDYISSLLRWIVIEKEFYREKWEPYFPKEWKKYFADDVRKFLIYWLYPLKTDRAMRSKIDIDKLEKVIRKDVIDKTLKKELKMKDREIKKVNREVNKSFKKIHKLKLKDGVKNARMGRV